MRQGRPTRCGACGEGLPGDARYCPACGEPAVIPLRPAVLIAGWFVVGLLVAASLLAFISFFWAGFATAPFAVLLGSQLERRGGKGETKWAIAPGMAALPLFLAYMNRHGPGTYCHAIGTPRYPGTECGDEWDPRPFVAAAIALVVLPLVAIPFRRHPLRHG